MIMPLVAAALPGQAEMLKDLRDWTESIVNAFAYRPAMGVDMLVSFETEVLVKERARVEIERQTYDHIWSVSYAFRTAARERRAELELKRTSALLRYLREREAPTLTAAET